MKGKPESKEGAALERLLSSKEIRGKAEAQLIFNQSSINFNSTAVCDDPQYRSTGTGAWIDTRRRPYGM